MLATLVRKLDGFVAIARECGQAEMINDQLLLGWRGSAERADAAPHGHGPGDGAESQRRDAGPGTTSLHSALASRSPDLVERYLELVEAALVEVGGRGGGGQAGLGMMELLAPSNQHEVAGVGLCFQMGFNPASH